MDIAAEAVADIIAPPPRPTTAAARGAAENSADDPTFGDLVNTALDRADGRNEAKTKDAETSKNAPASDDSAQLAAAQVLAPQGAPPPQATQALLDVIAQLEANHPSTPPTPEAPENKPADAAQKSGPDKTPQVPVHMAPIAAEQIPQAAMAALASETAQPPPDEAMAPAAKAIQVLQALVSNSDDSNSAAAADDQAQAADATAAQTPALIAVAAMAPPAPKSNAPAPAKADTQTTKASAADDILSLAPPAPDAGNVQSAPAPERPSAGDFKLALQALSERDTGRQSATMAASASETATSRLDGGPSPLSALNSPSAIQDAAPAAAVAHARAAVPAVQVAQEIIRRFDGDSTTLHLRLDPPELGRVEIRLDVGRDHRVSATVAADNPQALADLVRHARELEQTLQSAGLTLNDNGLSFDLRQGSERNSDASDAGATDANAGGESDTAPADTPPTLARPLGYELWRGVRVDISV